jgi:predicted sugar kinase
MAIRPEITQKEIEKACAGITGCILWTINMQEYGGFVVDNSGHPKTYAEGNATANWDASIWTEDMLRNIPSDWYVVIDWTKAP